MHGVLTRAGGEPRACRAEQDSSKRGPGVFGPMPAMTGQAANSFNRQRSPSDVGGHWGS
jgi:hypothetical protein